MGVKIGNLKLTSGFVGGKSLSKIWVGNELKWGNVYYWLELPLTIHKSDGKSRGYYFYSNPQNPDEYKENTNTLFFNGTIRFTSSGKVDTSSMKKARISYNDTSQLDRYEWYYNKTYNAVGKVAGYRKRIDEKTNGEKEYTVISDDSYGSLYFVEAIENGGFNIVTSNNKEQFPDGGCVGEKYYVRYYPDEPDCFSGSISVNVTEVDNAVFKFIQTEPNGVIITTSDGYTYSSAGTGLVKVYVPKTVFKTITLQRVKGLFIPCSTVASSTYPRSYYAGCIRGSYTGGSLDTLANLYSNLTISGRFETLYENSLSFESSKETNSPSKYLKVYAGTKNFNVNSITLVDSSNAVRENYFYYYDTDDVGELSLEVNGTSKSSKTYNCYTDNTKIHDKLISLADAYNIINVKHLDGSDW